LPNRANTMQKAKLSVQLGSAKAFFGQTHHDYTCNTQDELTQEIVMERVMHASGSGSKVIDNTTGRTALKSQVQGAGTSSAGKSTGKKQDEITVDDAVGQALKQVRSGAATWVVATYDGDRPHVILKSSGSGDVSEMRQELADDAVCYAVVRKIEQIDATEAVKFVYIRWVGTNVATMQRAKLPVHAGAMSKYFAPAHVTLDAPDIAEITDENLMTAIKKASGTFQHVREAPRSPSTPSYRGGGGGGIKTHGGVQATVEAIVTFEDENGIRAAIKSVRVDSDPTNWVLITYTAEKSKVLKLLATGTGGLDELKSHLSDKIVAYGLYRATEQVDESVTTKFVFCDWRGNNVNRMQKAALGTHSGAVKEMFHPYHVDILASDDSEITEELIQEKIKHASGTAVHVRS